MMVCTIRLENGSLPSNLINPNERHHESISCLMFQTCHILATLIQHSLNHQFSGVWARGYGNKKMVRSIIVFWAQLIAGISTFKVRYCKIRICESQLLSAQSHLRSDKSGRRSGSINYGTSALKNKALMRKDSIISHLAVNCSNPIQVKHLGERIQRWCLIKI